MDSFIFKGISSTDFNGIVVNSLPPISKPPKRVNKIQIDGRDGDITEFLGYDSYDKEIEITVLKETNIDELIKWLNGKGTLVLSNEPDKCYEAEIINQIDFSRLEKYEKNKIKFHCQPFKHLLNEIELKKENLSKTSSGTSIDLNDSTEMRCELKISGNSVQNGDPTPDTPVEVECCGDNINLYNAPYRENNKLIITATQDDDYKILSYYAYLEAGKKYRVSFESDGSYGRDSGTDTIQIYLMKDKSFDTIITIFSKNEIISPTVSGNYYIRADVNKNGKSHSFWNFKIKKGSTETGEYSPYGQGCINEVICNKNKLDISKIGSIAYKNGIRNNGDLEHSINPTVDNRDWTYNSSNHFIDLKAGTYTLTVFFETKISKSGSGLSIYASTGKQLKFLTVYDVDKATTTFTIEEDTNIGIFFKIYDGKARLQLEEGTTATPYEEHKEQTYTIPTQQPMRAIGDIRDTFVKVDGKWIERHNVNRIIFDGTENWAIDTFNNLYRFNCQELPDLGYTTRIDKINSLCNIAHSPKTTEYVTENNCFLLRYINDTNRIDFVTDKFTKVDEWNAYLAEQYANGTPVYVDYILETPLDIECTEEQSTILFDIEQNAKTYDKVTHMYSTDKISSYKEVTYYLDNRLTITNAGNTESKPVIKIYGKDDIYMYLNDVQVLKIELGNEEYITIDAEKMEAYKDTLDVLKNRLVTGNYDNILLKQGQNILYFEGKVSKVEVSNYSRWT